MNTIVKTRQGEVRGSFAHGVVAHRDVTHETAHVNADFALEVIEIFTVAMPVPFDALFQRDARHRFDAHEAFHDGVFIASLDRRQGESAVAHDDGGHAMLRLTSAVRIPEQLRV